ncbi:heat shock protein beta-11-like [Amia ocellicauda]|uniref:heat shock protein beta 9-like n=1 Tax=Amia ocellicauda TaxID=2972642 RepID=UPI0034641686|nr:HSPBB protein [Amia calva]MBN3310645.1 HSPBB protein [Amia calva]MBN3310646.1 HSPBB protein [Amia calva]
MLCSRVFQPAFSPLMDFHWPVRSLWPETRPFHIQLEQEMLKHMQEMRSSLNIMGQLHERIFREMEGADQGPASLAVNPVSYKIEKEGERFAVTLDTKDFSPEELSVKQVGRKLRVSGKQEKRQEDGKGSYSYKCQEFRQEFELPEDVKPDAVTCSLSDGQLQIQAARVALPREVERDLPIDSSPAVKTPMSQSSEAEGSSAEKLSDQERAGSAKA